MPSRWRCLFLCILWCGKRESERGVGCLDDVSVVEDRERSKTMTKFCAGGKVEVC